MIRHALLLALFVVPATVRGSPRIEQVTRLVPLDANTLVHTVEVTGWAGMNTTVQFTDSFEAVNVLCGQCRELTSNDASGPVERADRDDGRNWIIEKRVAERSIHVRPAILPTLPRGKAPASGFATNIYVALNGGHSVNIALRLMHPADMPAGAPLAADAVVTLKLPSEATMAGKLADAHKKLTEEFEVNARKKSHQLMLERLAPAVRYRDVRWRKPYRTDKTLAQLNQLCFNADDHKTFWITFDLENRGDTELYLDDVTLAPEGDKAACKEDPMTWSLNRESLGFGETAKGIAMCTLTEDSPNPSTWFLKVSPAGRDTIHIEHLDFVRGRHEQQQ